MIFGTSAEETRQQGDQGGADQGNAAAGHQLYHGELAVKGFLKIKTQGLKSPLRAFVIGQDEAIHGLAGEESEKDLRETDVRILEYSAEKWYHQHRNRKGAKASRSPWKSQKT